VTMVTLQLEGSDGDPADLELTHHAADRMVERGIRFAELDAAMLSRLSTVRDARGYTVFGRNGVALVLDLTGRVVITVLPRGMAPDRWRGRDEGLRGYRRDTSISRNRTPRRSA